MKLDNEMMVLNDNEMTQKAKKAVDSSVVAISTSYFEPITFDEKSYFFQVQASLLKTICGLYKINFNENEPESIVKGVLNESGIIEKQCDVNNPMTMIPGVSAATGKILSAKNASIIVLSMGRAFIKICNYILAGKFNEADLFTFIGESLLTYEFVKEYEKDKKQQ